MIPFSIRLGEHNIADQRGNKIKIMQNLWIFQIKITPVFMKYS